MMRWLLVLLVCVVGLYGCSPPGELIGTTKEAEEVSQAAGKTVVRFKACIPTGAGVEADDDDVDADNVMVWPDDFPEAMMSTLIGSCTPVDVVWIDGREKGHVSLRIYNPVSGRLIAWYEADDVKIDEGVLLALADVKAKIAAGQQELTAEAIADITETLGGIIDVFKLKVLPIPLE